MKLDQIDSVEQTANEWRREAQAAELITSNFIPVNMWMVRYIGLDATLFLGAAYEEFLFLREKKKNYSKDSIIFSARKAQQKTGLGSDRQKRAINILHNHRLIDCRIENGIPKKRIIIFNFGSFSAFELDLKQFVEEDIKKTKEQQLKFKDEMLHVRHAANKAAYEACKKDWEKHHPGQSYDEYERSLPF